MYSLRLRATGSTCAEVRLGSTPQGPLELCSSVGGDLGAVHIGHVGQGLSRLHLRQGQRGTER